MFQLVINQVPITYPKTPIDIYVKPGQELDTYHNISHLLPKLNNLETTDLRTYLEGITENSHIGIKFDNNGGDTTLKKLTINLTEEPYFIRPYLAQKIKAFFVSKGYTTASNFLGELEVWEKKNTFSNFDEYVVWNLKIDRQFTEYYLTICLDSQSSKIHKQTVSELKLDTGLVKKVLIDNKIYKTKFIEGNKTLQGKPLLNRSIINSLSLTSIPKSPDFSFMNHYRMITQFYESNLKGQELDTGVSILASGLREVKNIEIIEIPREKNLLEFGNGKTEYDPYRGFSNYGPFFVPEDVNKIKFIFIYAKTDRDIANNLYKYFKYGYRHFPGLETFAKIPFDIDTENSIRFEDSTNPFPEINERLKNLKLDPQSKYVALYISPFSEETASDQEKMAYFQVKEALLKLNITSQAIESIKLKAQAVHFYLPNMAIAILAKINGIPWKLKRDLGSCLLIGYGDSKLNSNGNIRYIGNTVCFDNSGIFKDLTCFEYTEENLQASLENAIAGHIKQNGEPQKLIIHYFKEWGFKEAKKLAEVFKKLNLSIPYIVLNINDTKARDYICFDESYPGKIPVSGTVVEIKKGRTFLLFNNERHSYDIATYKGDDKYPIRINITANNGIDITNRNEVIELIDQVYEFSRLYWRSIKQKAVPVTIEYAKELSEKVFFFSTKELPNTDIARKTLWFI